MEISFIHTQILDQLHVNKTNNNERLRIRTHFETAAKGNSEIAYCALVLVVWKIQEIYSNIFDFVFSAYEQYTYSNTMVASTLSTALFAIASVSFLAFNKQSRKLWHFWYFKLKKCCC